jgi:hypothetical protein
MMRLSGVGRAGLGWLLFGLALGCSGKSESKAGVALGEGARKGSGDAWPAAGAADGPGSAAPQDAAPGLGWSSRDGTPFGRSHAHVVVDTLADRLLVIGYTATEIWSLPLSGPDASRWRQLVPEGDVHPDVLHDSVFDAGRNRVLGSSTIADGTSNPQGSLWELSLFPVPRWREIATGRSHAPQVRLSFDSNQNRLFGLAPRASHCATSSIQLDSEAGSAWTMVGKSPFDDCQISAQNALHTLVFDGLRERLVSISGREAWQLPLNGDDASWTMLESAPVSVDYARGAFDPSRQRIVMVGGSGATVSSFDMASDAWQIHDDFAVPNWFAGAALDPTRDRLLFFSGLDGTSVVGNATWQLALEPFELQVLTPNSRGRAIDDRAAIVWDPHRGAALTWGAESSEVATTRQHGLQRAATWLDLGASGSLGHAGQKAVYDAARRAVLSFGGTQTLFPSGETVLSDAVMRLDSQPGADWERLDVPVGPCARHGQVAVYDSVRQRLVIHGGQGEILPTNFLPAEDSWALSLDGEPVWTLLSGGAGGPGPRLEQAGVYDPIGQRLIVFGGSDVLGERQSDVHALSLGDDASTWSVLAVDGTAPKMRAPAAFYDAAGQRVVFAQLDYEGTNVAALELGATPRWHTFCPVGQVPGRVGSNAGIVLAPDGLFAAFGDATFRFDLQTPYCD